MKQRNKHRSTASSGSNRKEKKIVKGKLFMRCFLILSLLFMASQLSATEFPKKFEMQKFRFDQSPPAFGTMDLYAFRSSAAIVPKSKKKAFFLSLLIPGMGELYLRDWKYRDWGSGQYFFAGEFLMWGGHFYFQSHSRWLESDSRALAAQYAGVDLSTPKPQGYYINLGQFSDIYSYNQTQRRLTGTQNVYAENPETYWKWDNAAHQARYERLRASGRRNDRYAQYFYYGIFVNHILGAIHAVRVFKHIERISGAELHFDVRRNYAYTKDGSYEIRASLSKHF
jgi:hypothetical protein